eukprot:CAMPEP_0119064144 /NCGR_PEP_ID=MMETSP1178-20130426/7316_1 /TAXON_ID=33656 /ORGANISM="unid sp, Strain CCMP2000" /LENGTH=256 /DNA_ID=CAMNT_0007045565 /DNA_START=66 /DNA_END=833 /DNA_ORIENTATION=+
MKMATVALLMASVSMARAACQTTDEVELYMMLSDNSKLFEVLNLFPVGNSNYPDLVGKAWKGVNDLTITNLADSSEIQIPVPSTLTQVPVAADKFSHITETFCLKKNAKHAIKINFGPDSLPYEERAKQEAQLGAVINAGIGGVPTRPYHPYWNLLYADDGPYTHSQVVSTNTGVLAEIANPSSQYVAVVQTGLYVQGAVSVYAGPVDAVPCFNPDYIQIDNDGKIEVDRGRRRLEGCACPASCSLPPPSPPPPSP